MFRGLDGTFHGISCPYHFNIPTLRSAIQRRVLRHCHTVPTVLVAGIFILQTFARNCKHFRRANLTSLVISILFLLNIIHFLITSRIFNSVIQCVLLRIDQKNINETQSIKILYVISNIKIRTPTIIISLYQESSKSQ